MFQRNPYDDFDQFDELGRPKKAQQQQGIQVTPPDPRRPYQLQQEQGQAAAAPFAAPRAAADLTRTNQQIVAQPIQNESTRTNTEQTRQQMGLARTKAEQDFSQQFLGQPEVKMFQTVAQQYGAAIRAARTGTKSSDYDLINAYAKLLDPNSVVREGEVKLSGEAGSQADAINAWVSKIKGTGLLDDEQRKQIMMQVRNRAGSSADQYRQSREYWGGVAGQYGFAPDRVLGPNYAQPYQQLEADYFGHPIKNGNALVEPRGVDHPGAPKNRGPLDPNGEGDIGFNQSAQGLPPHAQDAQRDIQEMIASGKLTTPEAIVSYAKSKWALDADPKTAAAAIDSIGKGGGFTVGTPQFQRDIKDARGTKEADAKLAMQQQIMSGFGPAGGIIQGIGQIAGPQKADAFMRGAADVPLMGMSEEIGAGIQSGLGNGTFQQNLANQNGIRDYDKENNFKTRLAGQVLGGLALPTGVMGEARNAGTAALRGGLGRAEALQAATRAGALQAGREGALYGGGYGFGSTDGNLGERALGAGENALIGAGTGYLGGRVAGSLFGRNGGRRPVRPGTSELPPLVDPATGSLNQPLENATMAERVAAGKQYGMDMSMDAAGGRTAAILGKGLDIMPGSAGVMEDARRGLHAQTEAAVGGLGDRFGGAKTMDEAGNALQSGAKGWIDRLDHVVSKAYDAIPIKGTAQAALGNTRAALSRLTTIFQSNPQLAEAFSNSRLNTYLNALSEKVSNVDTGLLSANGKPISRQVKQAGGLSWQDLKDMRSRIGYEIGEQRFSDSPTKDELRGLYGAMSEDMRATAQAAGPGALHRFERANTLYAQGQERIEGALVRILGDNSKNNPEAAAAAIQTIAKGGRASSNIQQLAQIRASLRKGPEWNEVASTLIRLGGQPANSQGREFNPQTFLNWYADMAEPARNLLFGDGGRQDLRKALDGFVAVTQRLQNTSALRNTSNTAPGITAAGAVSTIAAAPWHPLAAAGAAGTGATLYGGAKLWTSTKFVQWATGYTKAMDSGRMTEAAGQAWIRRLNNVAKTEPAIANDVLGVQQQIAQQLQTIGRPAAASESEEQKRRRRY